MADCANLPRNTIFFGCCPTNRLIWAQASVSLYGWVDFDRDRNLFQSSNSQRLWRTRTRVWSKFRTDFFASQTIIETFPNPWVDGLTAGSCGMNTVVQYNPDEATFNSRGGNGSVGVFTVSSATRYTRVHGDVEGGSYDSVSGELTGQITEETMWSEMSRLDALIDADVPNMVIAPRDAPLFWFQNVPGKKRVNMTYNIRCDGTLVRGGLVFAPLMSHHSVERAYMQATRPTPRPDARGNPGLGETSSWELYWANIYANITPGAAYCEVTRSRIPFDAGFNTTLDLQGGIQGSCERKISPGSIIIKPPRCALGSNSGVDVYTPFTYYAPPPCCGMVP